jgi:hypothetical protein
VIERRRVSLTETVYVRLGVVRSEVEPRSCPAAQLCAPREAGSRALMAASHALASALYIASPDETWSVSLTPPYALGGAQIGADLSIELVDASPHALARAEEVLSRTVEDLRWT